MEVSYSSFRVKTETDSLLLGRWEKWKSRGSCGISKRSGKVLPLDFSAERLFPPPFYPRIVLETQICQGPEFQDYTSNEDDAAQGAGRLMSGTGSEGILEVL